MAPRWEVDFKEAKEVLDRLPAGTSLYVQLVWVGTASGETTPSVHYSRFPLSIGLPAVAGPFEPILTPRKATPHFADYFASGQGVLPDATMEASLLTEGYELKYAFTTLSYYHESGILTELKPITAGQAESPLALLRLAARIGGTPSSLRLNYNATKYTPNDPNTEYVFYSLEQKIEFGVPPPAMYTAGEPLPCDAQVLYETPSGRLVRADLTKLLDYFQEAREPSYSWRLHIDYNNDTCPWRLAQAALLPTDDWT